MLSRALRRILLVIALLYTVWPDLIGASTRWIALIAVVILLIAEFTHGQGSGRNSMVTMPARRSSVRRRTLARRRAPVRRKKRRR